MSLVRRTPYLLLLALVAAPSSSYAVALLDSNAFIIAIDSDEAQSDSFYFPGEGSTSAIDGISNTKYLNLGLPPVELGIAVSPLSTLGGGVVAQSIQFTTADDAENRDPKGWVLYGTNDFVTSTDNGPLEGSETWNQIAAGDLTFPADRQTVLPPINFTNSSAYQNYRVEFTGAKGGPGARDAFNGIQVADVQIYTGPDASGSGVFGIADTAIAYQLPQPDSFYFADESPSNLVDFDYASSSNYPGGENPTLAFDGDTGTKYLNFAGENSGFIVTPSTASQVQSFVLTSANDALGRHPTSFTLFGTNDPILSADNSLGTAENWTEIDNGAITVPANFFEDSPLVTVNNPNSYSSYKMLFPTLNGEGLMQISEASFFTTTDGSGLDVLEGGGTSVLAIDADRGTTKHFNGGRDNAGVIVTPAPGTSILDGFQLTTANDAAHRDPATWEIYGTNDTIVSEDNGQGLDESWTLIESGTFSELEVPEDRNATGEVVPLTSSTEYASYKIVFPTVRDMEQDNGFQLADIQLFGDVITPAPSFGDFNADGVVDAADYTTWRNALGDPDDSIALNGNGDGGDVSQSDYDVWRDNYGRTYAFAAGISSAVPEPTSALLVLAALAPLGLRGRRVA